MSGIEKGQRHRRELLRLLAIGLGLGTFAVSTVCGAQQSGKAYRVGFLPGTSPPPSSSKSSVKGCASSDMWKARAHALPELSTLNDHETSLIP